MSKKLQIKEFGNPILRKKSKRLSKNEILLHKTQQLIADMKHTAKSGEYGVGIAAPQVGKSLALSAITIRPTPSHPGREVFDSVIINPEITEYVGDEEPMWEGCISFGGEPVFAKVPRYRTIKVTYLDEAAERHEETLSGFVAHVFQHEVDHLNGILFVDRVEDSTSWMNSSEYKKMARRNSSKD